MLRRIILYLVIGAAVYVGYSKYMEFTSSVQLRTTSEQEEENRGFTVSAAKNDNQSNAERALRRRESTEKQATSLPSGH